MPRRKHVTAASTTASISVPDDLHFMDSFWPEYVRDSRVAQPWIWFEAVQSGVKVYSDVHAAFLGGYGYSVPFVCGPSMRWTGGAADCLVKLGHVDDEGKAITDASFAFKVAA